MADVESVSASSSTVVQQPSPTSTSHMSPIIPLIAAELQSDPQSSVASVQIQQSSSSSTMNVSSGGRSSSTEGGSSTSAGGNRNMDICAEPELKKVKLDHGGGGGLGLHSSASMTSGTGRSQREEKLESRLGGILCCAVCLDLPKTAMYQVSLSCCCCCCFLPLRNCPPAVLLRCSCGCGWMNRVVSDDSHKG